MKKIIQVLAVAATVAVISALTAFAAENNSAKVTVYYFHGNFRCATCTNMEKYSREAIELGFKDALASEKLEFRSINVEDKENEHFVNDYQLYTKALILSLVKGGKEIRSKNLVKIWELAGNKNRFIGYVTGELGKFLEEAE